MGKYPGEIRSGIFTESRLGLCASGVAIGYAIALLWQLAHHPVVIGAAGKDCLDFTWIWLSSKFAVSGALAQAYSYPIFSAARNALVGPPDCILQHFDYPPTLLFFSYPLGVMPYSFAFAVWMAATLAVYLGTLYLILPCRAALIVGISVYPAFFNLLLGHDGFLTAGLVGLSLVMAERRPWAAGILLGLLTYKPQFGILFPIALLASRNWRSFLSAGVASLIFGMAAAGVFGYETWPAFFAALTERASRLSDVPRLDLPLVSIFGFLRVWGASSEAAWAAQLAVSGAVVATVGFLWSRTTSHPLKAAALASGAVLAAPHVISYDVCILSVAAAFVVSDGLARGFLRGERMTLLICWAALVLSGGPVPAMICIALLVLVVRRALRHPANAAATTPPALQTEAQTS